MTQHSREPMEWRRRDRHFARFRRSKGAPPCDKKRSSARTCAAALASFRSDGSRQARGAGHVFGRLAGRVPCRESEPGRDLIVVAQRTEHQVFNLGVTGSTPVHNDAVGSKSDRRDAENVLTTGPEGDGRPCRSALVRFEASFAAPEPAGCNAHGRPEARGFRCLSPAAMGRHRGARHEVSASSECPPGEPRPPAGAGSSGAPRLEA